MNYFKLFRTALLSLVAVFTLGLTACDPDDNADKSPAELIIGSWNATTQETYIGSNLNTKVDYANGIIYFYSGTADGTYETDSIDAGLSYAFAADSIATITASEEDEYDSYECNYIIEKNGKTTTLTFSEGTDTDSYNVTTLTKSDLVLEQAGNLEGLSYTSKIHFKKEK